MCKEIFAPRLHKIWQENFSEKKENSISLTKQHKK